ncbi:DUF805 domain-containing protein [Staphylococcus pseudoxylosus]|uniref:DUF805 domain-containing protein n=1 Tax=Staphylococcus pseudoxylosus TaxID=2282419 RepID=UPI00384C96A8
MLHYYKLFWVNALNVTGRSRRKAYWYPMLMNMLLYTVISLFLYIAPIPTIIEEIIAWVIYILVIIAMFTVTVRRFHDVGMTMLIPILIFLVTFLEDINRLMDTDITTMDNPVVDIVLIIVGVIYLVIAIVALVVCCSKGQKEDNQYGPNPKRTVYKK